MSKHKKADPKNEEEIREYFRTYIEVGFGKNVAKYKETEDYFDVQFNNIEEPIRISISNSIKEMRAKLREERESAINRQKVRNREAFKKYAIEKYSEYNPTIEYRYSNVRVSFNAQKELGNKAVSTTPICNINSMRNNLDKDVKSMIANKKKNDNKCFLRSIFPLAAIESTDFIPQKNIVKVGAVYEIPMDIFEMDKEDAKNKLIADFPKAYLKYVKDYIQNEKGKEALRKMLLSCETQDTSEDIKGIKQCSSIKEVKIKMSSSSKSFRSKIVVKRKMDEDFIFDIDFEDVFRTSLCIDDYNSKIVALIRAGIQSNNLIEPKKCFYDINPEIINSGEYLTNKILPGNIEFRYWRPNAFGFGTLFAVSENGQNKIIYKEQKGEDALRIGKLVVAEDNKRIFIPEVKTFYSETGDPFMCDVLEKIFEEEAKKQNVKALEVYFNQKYMCINSDDMFYYTDFIGRTYEESIKEQMEEIKKKTDAIFDDLEHQEPISPYAYEVLQILAGFDRYISISELCQTIRDNQNYVFSAEKYSVLNILKKLQLICVSNGKEKIPLIKVSYVKGEHIDYNAYSIDDRILKSAIAGLKQRKLKKKDIDDVKRDHKSIVYEEYMNQLMSEGKWGTCVNELISCSRAQAEKLLEAEFGKNLVSHLSAEDREFLQFSLEALGVKKKILKNLFSEVVSN